MVYIAGCGDLDARTATPARQAISHESETTRAEPALQEFDLQVAPGRFLRGLCQLNADRLTLALPLLPNHPRPFDLESREDDTTRVIVLSRTESQISDTSNITGAWKTVSSRQSAKPSQEFLDDTLTFTAETVLITESQTGESYEIPYRLNHLVATAANQQTAIQILRQTFDADITLNAQGKAKELTVSGIAEDGKTRIFDDALAEQIAGLNSLEQLTLTDFEEGMTAGRLAFLKQLHHLHKIDIRNTNLPDQALAPISELSHLEILKLEFNDQLTDGVAGYLQSLTHLVELDLAFVNITDAAMPSLSKLSGLQRLYLYGTQITDRGVSHLASLKNLRMLYLGSEEGQDVTDASVTVLSQFQSLELLGIYGTRISHVEATRLKTALPDCNVLSPPPPAEPEPELTSEAVPQGSASGTLIGSAAGTLILDGQQFALKHALTYEFMLDNGNVTTVLLTAEPAPVGKLKQILEHYGNDFTFAAYIPQVRLRYRPDGSLDTFHVYANDFTINGPGTGLITSGEVTPKRAQGSVRMKHARIFEGKSYHIDATFNVPQ